MAWQNNWTIKMETRKRLNDGTGQNVEMLRGMDGLGCK